MALHRSGLRTLSLNSLVSISNAKFCQIKGVLKWSTFFREAIEG